jgi:uncharacterized protein
MRRPVVVTVWSSSVPASPAPVRGPVSPLETGHISLRPLGLDQVVLTGGDWRNWQVANRQVTTPHALHWLAADGSVDNLRLVGPGGLPGHQRRGPLFTDSDIYKFLEGLGWDLGIEASPELQATTDELVAVLTDAQAPDGYLNSFVQAGLAERWGNLVNGHELYCLGHLIQAAIAHSRSTGRDDLLSIARRAADCIVNDFGDGRRDDTDGHPEIEMALVELYRETGVTSYLDLAQQLVDVRGHGVFNRGPSAYFDLAYYQDATPVRDETTVVGHAVRAVYLLAGVVDLYIETGERALLDSALRQWESMTATKTFVNGAIGSRFEGEAFGDSYELPPDLVYGETCATIANVMLSWRLLLVTGESRFADAIERALYNLFAASTSLERTGFFYNNPAQRRSAQPAAPTDTRPRRADAPGTRPIWFECACCPPNIMRTIASLGGYVATTDAGGVQLHQFLPVTVSAATAAGQVGLTVDTDYPTTGDIKVSITQTPDSPWTLSIRRPSWFPTASMTDAVEINGAGTAVGVLNDRGYLEVTREWSVGDVVGIHLDVSVRMTVSHPSVDAVRGTVAVERGPVVYCLESPDQPADISLDHIDIAADAAFSEQQKEIAGRSVTVLTATGSVRDDSGWDGSGWATLGQQPTPVRRDVDLTFIPYSLWANRGPSTMRVFVPLTA